MVNVLMRAIEVRVQNIKVGVQNAQLHIIPLHYSPFQSAFASHLWTAPPHVPVTVQWGTGNGRAKEKKLRIVLL